VASPQRGIAYTFFIGLVDRSNRPQFRVNPTLAAADFRLSQDGGALAPLTNLPAVSPAGSKQVSITLTAAEMTTDIATVIASDAAGDEWDDVLVTVETTIQTIDDVTIPADIPTVEQIADAYLARNLAGGAYGGRTVRDALRILRNRRFIVAGLLHVTLEDDLTDAWTAVVGQTPGDPVSDIDPT
jgi:3-polyprenyl-4-hydroxybenzoate decarboxylase